MTINRFSVLESVERNSETEMIGENTKRLIGHRKGGFATFQLPSSLLEFISAPTAECPIPTWTIFRPIRNQLAIAKPSPHVEGCTIGNNISFSILTTYTPMFHAMII
jgi:hypothetical protein